MTRPESSGSSDLALVRRPRRSGPGCGRSPGSTGAGVSARKRRGEELESIRSAGVVYSDPSPSRQHLQRISGRDVESRKYVRSTVSIGRLSLGRQQFSGVEFLDDLSQADQTVANSCFQGGQRHLKCQCYVGICHVGEKGHNEGLPLQWGDREQAAMNMLDVHVK